MSEKANVSSEVLDALLAGFQDCSSSTASLRGTVRAHINECLNTARTIVSRLEAIEKAAYIRAERCRQAYFSCQRRQKYDKETDSYKPSCDCESRDMKKADEEHYKAHEKLEQAQMRLNDMMNEVGYYEQPLGGEGIMNAITDDYIPQATERLMALKNKVVRYETLEFAGIDIGDSSSSTPTLQTPQSKSAEFGKGMERIREKMARRAALFDNYCPKCKCCPCQCDRIRELLMSRTR